MLRAWQFWEGYIGGFQPEDRIVISETQNKDGEVHGYSRKSVPIGRILQEQSEPLAQKIRWLFEKLCETGHSDPMCVRNRRERSQHPRGAGNSLSGIEQLNHNWGKRCPWYWVGCLLGPGGEQRNPLKP